MKVFLIIICFVFAGGQLAAQQLTLDTAIAIAMKNSPGLMISKNNVNIAGINNNYGIAGGLATGSGHLECNPADHEPRAEIFQSA